MTESTKVCVTCNQQHTRNGAECSACYEVKKRRKEGLPVVGDLFVCECGKEELHNFRTILFYGKSKKIMCESCITTQRKSVKLTHRGSLASKYGKVISSAKARGLDVSITKEYYAKQLFNKPCHYCGDNNETQGHGVDRIDSGLGYIEGNVVPCCPTCNVMKNIMSEKDMLNHMHKILKHKGVV